MFFFRNLLDTKVRLQFFVYTHWDPQTRIFLDRLVFRGIVLDPAQVTTIKVPPNPCMMVRIFYQEDIGGEWSVPQARCYVLRPK
jgi:hypothetical protein